MALAISLMALLATVYQLHLQRRHNENSLKPLAQITLTDRGKLLAVHIENNGVGPLIVEKLTFTRDGKHYTNIEDCLNLDPRSYQHIPVTEDVKQVILPGSHEEVFSMQFGEDTTDKEMNSVRKQLAALKLKVDGRDIYDNKISVERDLQWFVRHNIA
ncbi:hypothetical protein [Tunicatimonas pelagia]|uniref:hypothetical protein n=1 Tax=Tunicatimonas pelagia TaxID=931531 RepID=UPI002666709F|nr:hypothetical protein [Tunicatimonas pelagia]WKN45418.1 hypothetical protein P0M28_10660 [Tunicatimonas pelagia]